MAVDIPRTGCENADAMLIARNRGEVNVQARGKWDRNVRAQDAMAVRVIAAAMGQVIRE